MTLKNDHERASLSTFLLQVVQLGGLLMVAHVFLIEQTYGLSQLLPIIFVAFIVNAWLPSAWRGLFFLLLFPVSAVALLGFLPASVLIVMGVALFLLCHLPVSFTIRAFVLLLVGLGLAAVRIGAVETAIPNVQSYLQTQTLPILAAMFMFRTAVYLYDLRHEKQAVPISQRLSYFFLFPNVCFPLFPVIDYQTYKRTYYDRPSQEIYQKGIDWVFRGITHLLLYRIVYHYFVPDPLAIQDLAGVAQYALSSFALYLRVSGLFHLIIGILCLFGYNLPETHHRYYLSESFTDFWRRINIYWKDFMVKMFYFPLFMAMRRWGVTTAMIAATLITFFITWFLHCYQWFWLRGTFPLVPQDMIFWGILALLVTGNSLYEEKFGRRRASLTKKTRPSTQEALMRSVKTVVVFIIICLLWSFWTCSSIDQWLAVMSVAGTASPGEISVALLIIIAAVSLGVVVQLVPGQAELKPVRRAAPIGRRAALIGSACLVLLLAANPALDKRVSPQIAGVVATITGDQLNTRDKQELVRGYYEELLGAESSGSMVWSVRLEQPDDWRWNGEPQSKYTIEVEDIRGDVMLPSISAIDKGQEFRTNRWGMRDQDYTQEKPDGVFRVALFGSSHSVGAGVKVEDTFPALVERHLNLISGDPGNRRIEILNFAYAGDSILRRAARFTKEALAFDPDAVIDMSITGEQHLAIRSLRIAVKNRIENIDPYLHDVVARAGVNPEMSSEEIERRLGPFQNEIIASAYRSVANTAREHGIPAVVFLLPKIGDADSAYDQEWLVLSRMWEEAGLAAVDVGDAYGPLNQRNEFKLAPWDWHPNAAGHALIAERILAELRDLDNFLPSAETSAKRTGATEND